MTSRKKKASIENDAVKRSALLRWLKANMPVRCSDGRVGLLSALSWNAGYDAGRRRGRAK